MAVRTSVPLPATLPAYLGFRETTCSKSESDRIQARRSLVQTTRRLRESFVRARASVSPAAPGAGMVTV